MKKDKPKKLAYTLDIDIYRCDLHFSFAESDDELRRFFNRNNIPEEEQKKVFDTWKRDGTLALCHLFDNGAGIIRMREIPTFASDFGTLQHEITHYIMLIMDNRGLKHNHETSEAFAYLTDFVTTKVYEKIMK